MKDDVESIAEGSDGEYNYDPDDQLQPEDTLDDRGVDDILDEGISPPEKPSPATRYGMTAEEQREGESLDQHLAEEEPDPATEVAFHENSAPRVPENDDEIETGRSGRGGAGQCVASRAARAAFSTACATALVACGLKTLGMM